jgi:hypothetical protein
VALYPAPVVVAPEPRGLRYGLLTAANGPLALPDRAAGGGLLYEPVTCGTARAYPVVCDDTPPTKTFDSIADYVEVDPFWVYSAAVCGAAGTTSAEMERKVRRYLEAGEQPAVEGQLAVDLAAASPFGLTASDPDDLQSVVGELEQWLYGTVGYGYTGYIHAPIRYGAYALGSAVAIKDSTLWRTPNGSIWVWGNYPDDGTLYITGQVTVWRSAEVNVPPPDQTFNRTTNQRYAVAERVYLVAWDCHVADISFDPELGLS